MKPTLLLPRQLFAPALLLNKTGQSETGPSAIIQSKTASDSPDTTLQLTPKGTPPGESICHILLGSTDAIQQTVHLLHALRYADTLLWSPLVMVEEPLTITPAQGDAMRLLRKQI